MPADTVGKVRATVTSQRTAALWEPLLLRLNHMLTIDL